MLMLCATILRIPKTARVNPDILEMGRLVKANVTKALTLIDELGNGN